MVDFRKLAVPGGLDGRNGDVWVAFDRQLEDGSVVRLRAAERANDHTGVDRIGEVEELKREFLQGLKLLATSMRVPRVHTNSNRDLPFSFTVNGYEMSSPLWGSCNRRKAWCGRFAELPSWVVKVTRSVSAPAMVTGFDSGFAEENLLIRKLALSTPVRILDRTVP